MDSPLILTFDVGTQSTRCLLVRPDGGFEDMCQVRHTPPYHSRNPGWAEQSPDFYYERICEAGRTVCGRNRAALGRVSAVALTGHHTRHHLYRAILEGIAFELCHSLRRMERRAGVRIEEIYVGGGGARSDVACQILADMFGLPVKRTQTHEVSAVGAAMAAFLAQGVFRSYDEAIRGMVQEGDVFVPDPAGHKLYAQLYRGAYARLYPRLEPLYRRISEITKRSDVL